MTEFSREKSFVNPILINSKTKVYKTLRNLKQSQTYWLF